MCVQTLDIYLALLGPPRRDYKQFCAPTRNARRVWAHFRNCSAFRFGCHLELGTTLATQAVGSPGREYTGAERRFFRTKPGKGQSVRVVLVRVVRRATCGNARRATKWVGGYGCSRPPLRAPLLRARGCCRGTKNKSFTAHRLVGPRAAHRLAGVFAVATAGMYAALRDAGHLHGDKNRSNGACALRATACL